MAIENEDKINRSRNIGTVWIVLIFAFGILPDSLRGGARGDGPSPPWWVMRGSDPERVYFVASEDHPLVHRPFADRCRRRHHEHGRLKLLLGSAIATDDLPRLKGVAHR